MADPASGVGPRLRSRASAAPLPAPTTVGRPLGEGRAWLALDHDGRPLATGRVP